MKKNKKLIEKLCGIYRFIEKPTNKSYIGQSNDIISRMRQHYTIPTNEWEKHLQDNPNTFSFEIVELCAENQLDAKEVYYIKQFDSYNNGLNKTPGNIHDADRFYENQLLKELQKPTLKWCIEELIDEANASESSEESYEIQKINLIKKFCNFQGKLMLYLCEIKCKYTIIPFAIFLTNEHIPYDIDLLLRQKYWQYYYNSIKPHHNGYTLDK